MGRLKTQAMRDNNAVRKAHRMAEAFAQHRAKDFLTTFLQTSGIPTWIFSLTESLTKVTQDLVVRLKTELEAANVSGDQIKAQKLQNEIADLEHLISDHATNEKGIIDDLIQDPTVDLQFGMAVALAYAMGYADHARGASLKQLYVPGHMTDKPEAPDEDVDKKESTDSPRS